MAIKSTISEADFSKILTNYDLGNYLGFETFANGAGQTTVLLKTTHGKFVLRYYENRPDKHVLFEIELFNYLRSRKYPIPAIIKNRSGQFLGNYQNKPYIIIEFIDGQHGKNPNDYLDNKEFSEVAKAVAQLHNLTLNYNPEYFKDREVFDADYCLREFHKKPDKIGNAEKEIWLKNQLAELELPDFLPKGLCHADLNYGNFLFRDGEIVAVLDFDMSFYTYLVYDIASLIYWWAGNLEKDLKIMKFIVSEYSKWRQLTDLEKMHIYDALKLIMLLGISWPDEGDDDFEKNKIAVESLNSIGREGFYKNLFGAK